MPFLFPTNNLFKRRRKTQFQNLQDSIQIPISDSSSPSTFPLHQKHKNLLPGFQEFQEDKVYLQLLHVASSPEIELESAYVVTPDIVNTLDRGQGASPLHYACMNGNIPAIHFLLENGADVNNWDAGKNVTPLICSAAHGHLDAVKLLLDHGCNIDDGLNGGNEGQYSALLWAVRRNHSKVVEFLLEKGASQSCTDPFAETPIHAAVMCDSPEILRILIKHLNQQDIKEKSNLSMAPEKSSPLHLAVLEENRNAFELCKILLEEGNADANSLDANRRTPLHGAVHNAQIINLLLVHNAMINAVDVEGRTPLFYAINEEDKAVDSIKALVTAGDCNVNHQDNHGNTPLHIAGLLKDTGAVEILLMHGADFSIKDDDGVSALSILRGNIPTAHLLLKRVFDQAATLADPQSKRQEKDCKVNVDFSLVLPSSRSKNDKKVGEELEMGERTTTSCFKRYARKESSKINCLIQEGFSKLLVHPVIRSFLELKWRKARMFYLPKLAFKILLVLLFTAYVALLYHLLGIYTRNLKKEHPDFNITTTQVLTNFCVEKEAAPFLNGLHKTMRIMVVVNAFMEVLEVLRAPKQQLKCMDPWLSVLVCYLMFKPMPPKCEDGPDNYDLSNVSLSILLSWVDVWIDMGRFPTVGLSIRVFLNVLKKFLAFMLPHASLLLGFIVALSLLFVSEDTEFEGTVVTKLIRVMAGDMTKDDKGIRDFIFTAYVLIVAVVMMNLLNGLAVNNMREIYEYSATEVLLRQTMLVSTLETSLDGKWTSFFFPNRFFAKYINLFSSKGSSSKSLTFNPHDSTDSQLSNENKQALFSIASANRVANSNRKRRRSSPGYLLAHESNHEALYKLNSITGADYTDQLQELVESDKNLNTFLLAYLKNKTSNA